MLVIWYLCVTFRPLVKQTTTPNLYITIYIYFLDGCLCEVGAVRRGIRIVRRWGLNFSMSGDNGRDNAHSVTTREVLWTAGSFFSVLPSVQFVGLILPSNSRAEIRTRLHNFFQYQAIGMCHFRSLWNGLCDRHRAEITVMQFTGHSLPVHHSKVGPSPCPILSAEHTCAISFDYWPLGCVTSAIFGMAGVIIIERK